MRAQSLQREIEEELARRLGRPCLFLPSGRLALYLALRTWLESGDRLLMSPITDDVVFFIVLAAGLRPVFTPVSSEDGNIDPAALPEATWARIDGVLTTNLYGLPDRMVELEARCRLLGIPLIEDAAHALLSDVDGRPIGSFGEAAAFSLSKNLGVAGGVLACPSGVRLDELRRRARGLQVPATARQRAAAVLEDPGRRLLGALGMRAAARRFLTRPERAGCRMPLQAPALARAVAAARVVDERVALDGLDRWTRVDLHRYRMAPPALELARGLSRLRALDRDRGRRVAGVERLRELQAVSPAVRRGPARALFRVPFLVEDRDAVRDELMRRGLPTWYLYDPPLDDYGGAELGEPSPAPERARAFARHVLPVDPLQADRVLDTLRAAGLRLRPAALEVPAVRGLDPVA